MSCGGLGFMATRPEVNRWRETCPTDIPLTLMLIVSEYAMRLLFHKLSLFDKMETDDLNYIYKLHHLTEWTDFSPVVSRRSSVSAQPLFMPSLFFFFFSRHQTRFPLSRAVVIATHWLAERSARSDWMWLTSHDWVNEAMWQRRLMIWFIISHDRHFLAPEIAHQLSFYFVREHILLTEAHSLWLWGRSTSSTWFS